MSELLLIKTPGGFQPANPTSEDQAKKIKLGDIIHCKYNRLRNPGFHRKYFTLLNFAFEHWEPGAIDSKHGKPQKNFEQFRKDIAILSGFFETTIRIDGTRMTLRFYTATR